MGYRGIGHPLAVAFAIVAVVVNGHPGRVAHGALIAGWDFQTTTNGGTAVAASGAAQPTVFVANFGTGTLYLNGSNGSSLWTSSTSATRELDAFGGTAVNATNGLSTTTTSPSALAPVNSTANGKFMVFKFSMLNYQDLVVSLAAQRTSTGFNSQVWEYSSDGSTYSSIGTLSSGSVAGSLASAFATSGTLTFPVVTGFNNATDAYIRVTFSGATAPAGNNRIDNIQFNASTYIPPSSTLTWSGNGSTAGGGGTWTTSGANWSSTGSAPFGTSWNSGAKAVFGTAGGTVSVDGGGITATAGIDFDVDGYTLTGGGLAFGGASSIVSVAAASTATINAAISGSNGLQKTSAGTLVLGGANTFSGDVTVSGGTLQIAADGNLGDAANNLSLGGTLKTTASVAMGSGRDVTGAGTLDIAPGTTLTSSGAFTLSTTTLSNGGTLDLQGATPSLGGLTFGTAATVNGVGPVSLTGLTASAVTSGSAVLNPAIAFSSGDKTVDVGSGGTLTLAGAIAGLGNQRIAKTGSGTLVVSGSNSTSGYRVGSTGATPTYGGTLVLAAAAASGTGQLQLNYGTLEASAPLAFSNGLSIGGRSNGVAVLGGANAMTFSGSSGFFRGAGTSGPLRLDVNNATSLDGMVGSTSGTGSATGITIGGTGSLAINGNASALVDAITLQDLVDFRVNGTLGSGVSALANTRLSGTGTINGAVSMADLSILAPGTSPGTLTIGSSLVLSGSTILNYELSATSQVVGGGINDLTTGITNLTLAGVLNVAAIGDFMTVSAGAAWRLFEYSGTLNDLTLTLGSMPSLPAGMTYEIDTSTAGQVNLMVVPEPATWVLAALGGLLAAGFATRRRRFRA